MLKLKVENFDLLEDKKDAIEQILNAKVQYFNELLKRYPSEVTLELIFSKKPSGWKIDAYIEMQSGKTFFEESGKDVKGVLSTLLNKIKEHIKKTKALERKDYIYKRAKYRKSKLSQDAFLALIEFKNSNNKEAFDDGLKEVYADLEQDITEHYIDKGDNEAAAKEKAKELMEKIKQDVFDSFTAQSDQREEFLDSLSDFSMYWEGK